MRGAAAPQSGAGAFAARLLALAAAAIVAVSAAASRAGGDEALRVETDAKGYFVLPEDAPAEVWPGDGVRAIVGRYGRFEHATLEKRAHPEAAGSSVFVRGADGAFERRALERAPSARPLRDPFVAAAAEWAKERAQTDPGGWDPPKVAALDWKEARRAPLPDVAAPELSPDEKSIAWLPFVRFRSTEAAFRLSDIADRISARLLALAGDGRDYGTLRWALHDLTLPAVWSANPEGTRSVDACAVLFGGLPWRERPTFVAMLHIADPELHGMESVAGVSYAALPEHLWTPEDDPDPASRTRRSVRRVEGDVEFVGSDETLLDAVQRSNADRLWRELRGRPAVAARSEADREAAFLFVPATARRAFAGDAAARGSAFRGAWTEQRGWAHVWNGWTGAAADLAARMPLTPPPARPALLASLVSVRVLTDATGADVVVTFEEESSARAAAATLSEAAKPFTGAAAVCARNRCDVAPLAVMDRPQKDLAERAFVVLGWKPVCPCRGTYSAHPVTRDVACSVHGTDARPSPEPKPLKAVLRDVTTDGAVVRFRVPIDWDR